MGELTNVFEYFAERERRESAASMGMALGAATFFGVVVARTVGAIWGALGFLVVAAYVFNLRRRTKRSADATLRVKGGCLTVERKAGWHSLAIPLEELEDVVLDTKSVQQFQGDTSGGFPDIRAPHTRMGPVIERSRIELVTTNDLVELTQRYTSSIDASECLTRIRRFLRDHGWQPLDERNEH